MFDSRAPDRSRPDTVRGWPMLSLTMWRLQRCIMHGAIGAGAGAARGREGGTLARGTPRAARHSPVIRTASAVSDARADSDFTLLLFPVRRRALSSSVHNIAGVKIKPATDGGVSS